MRHEYLRRSPRPVLFLDRHAGWQTGWYPLGFQVEATGLMETLLSTSMVETVKATGLSHGCRGSGRVEISSGRFSKLRILIASLE